MQIPYMSPQRYRVLQQLASNPQQSVRQIGAALALSPNGVHGHLRHARRDGLAETDGMLAGWRLTERGAALMDALARLPL